MILTAKDVAQRYYDNKITEATIRNYARTKKLPALQVASGNRILFNSTELDAYFANKFRIKPFKRKKGQ